MIFWWIHTAWEVTALPQKDLWQEMHGTRRDLAVPVIKYNSPHATGYAYGIYVLRAQSRHACVWSESAQLPSVQKGFMYFIHSVVSSKALNHRQIHYRNVLWVLLLHWQKLTVNDSSDLTSWQSTTQQRLKVHFTHPVWHRGLCCHRDLPGTSLLPSVISGTEKKEGLCHFVGLL